MSCVPSYVFTASRFSTCVIMPYSSTIPFPPSMSRHSRAMWMAFVQLFLFAMLIMFECSFPSSFILVNRATSCRPSTMSVQASASFFCTSWFAARGRLNISRSSRYRRAIATQSSAAPSAPQAMPRRAEFRHVNGPFMPTTSRTFPAGTRALSIMIIPVGEARSENFPSIFGVCNAVPLEGLSARSMTKPRTLPWSLEPSSCTFAQTMNTSAIGAFVIQVLEPERSQSSPSRFACVVMPAGSDPWLGSDSPNAPTMSPAASWGRRRSFSASCPNK
mmetsp:Transcript_25484/g.64213  ORF Transcript_25484/g.64213 Transcript_25484/m.64213 type:complete len:275 (-) Transcript_25484:871-1695(-)